ncbi:MAG: hypothetical protein WA705_11520 [Candidatus Ozemobacteraceae bacterium]
MGILDTWKKYRALDSRQQEFIWAGQRVCQFTKDEWLAFLRPLALFDAQGDQLRGKLGCSIFVVFFLGVVCMAFLPPLGLLFWIGSVITWMMYRTLAKRDIHNSLREFILPLVEIIGEDMAPEAKLKLRIDLRGFELDSKRISHREENMGWFAPYPRTVENIFKNPWLEGETRLRDGTTLQWKITDHVRKRVVTNKTGGLSRSKIKTKTKYKIEQIVDLRLAPKLGRYSVEEKQETAHGEKGITFRRGENRHVFSLRETRVESSIDTVFPKEFFIAALGKLFMQVRPVSNETKG